MFRLQSPPIKPVIAVKMSIWKSSHVIQDGANEKKSISQNLVTRESLSGLHGLYSCLSR